MKKNIFIYIIGLIITLVAILFTFLYYKSNNILTIYTTGDSYAYNYAKTNMINVIDISTSHKDYFDYVYEDFKANLDDEGLSIINYEGISEELIIPEYYNGVKVYKIEKGALPNTVKKVVLSSNITSINEDDFTNIEIKCYNNDYCNKLKENTKLNVTIITDTESYTKALETLDFTYNLNNNEIELTNYISDIETILVPKTINGYKVTSINFDGEKVTSMFIPSTVTSINADITSNLFNKCFKTSILVLIISLVIYEICIFISKVYSSIDKTYIYGTSILYLGITIYLVYIISKNPFNNLLYIKYFILLSILYIILNVLYTMAIKKNVVFDEEIKNSNNFIKEIELLLLNYDLDELKEIKELVKYSDPISIDEVKDIEESIKKEIKEIDGDNLTEKCDTIKKLLKKRNLIIKNNK